MTKSGIQHFVVDNVFIPCKIGLPTGKYCEESMTMRVKTLVATNDTAYTNHISGYISEHHADTMEISVCNTVGHLREMLRTRRYDVALMDAQMIKEVDFDCVKLPMLLCSWQDTTGISIVPDKIRKHRRISKTVSDVLEKYATVSGNIDISAERISKITAVWSPAGGVGKTTVALACCAAAASKEKEVFYLNLESFSSISAYFAQDSKSISAVFEMLENDTGNVGMFIQGIYSSESGIKYLCPPENFDDMCILSADNVRELVSNCAGITDELFIDLSSVCDGRTRQVFELSDRVLIVTDKSDTAQHKLTQFITQSNVYESIKEKITLVANKGAGQTAAISQEVLSLPYIDSMDTRFVYKALALHI